MAEARAEETGYMEQLGVYTEVPVAECWRVIGRAPVSTKWVEVNKGTEDKPDVRCRLVVRGFKPKGEKDRFDLFAAMPPLDAKKVLFQMAVSENLGKRRRGLPGIKVMLIDVKKAHHQGCLKEDERAYTGLPDKPGVCGRLRRWLYGMRPAAGAWEEDYSNLLESLGFAKGVAHPTTFYRSADKVRCVVHGDDFTFTGEKAALKQVERDMRARYDLKLRGVLGDEADDDKEITILNRIIRWKAEGIEYEADPRHAQAIMDYFGLGADSNGLDVPAVREKLGDAEAEEELPASGAREFRSLAARANYLASDRMDVQFAAKEACRDMAKPRVASVRKLKRLARYLARYPRGTVLFEPAGDEGMGPVEVYTDSDWAGCPRSRKSTSGGMLFVGGGLVKSWSSTQGTIALSSGEAELMALVRAATEGLGLQSLMADLGWDRPLRLWTDSAAAKAISSREGLGKTRHIETKYLWAQRTVKRRRFSLSKVTGKEHPADWLTKPGSASFRAEDMGRWGLKLHSPCPHPS